MEHLINLNFAPGGLPATVHVSQYDDTIRQLRFQLWFGRSKVEVPSGASVRVDIKKPDGHIVLVSGTVDSSDRSIVTVPTTKQMTAVPGGARGTLVVSSTGDKRISSAIFILQVHRDPVEDGDASDSDLSMLQDAIDQTAANATAAQAAATAAQQAASSFTTDTTLSVSGKAADAAETGRQFGLIKADLDAVEGLTDDIKEALLACFDNVAWKGEEGNAAKEALEEALYSNRYYEQEEWKLSTNALGKTTGTIVSYTGYGPAINSAGTYRRAFYAKKGLKPFANYSDGSQIDGVYPIPIPKGYNKATISITPATQYMYITTRSYINGQYSATAIDNSDWVQGSHTMSLTVPENGRMFLCISTKYNNAGTSYPVEPTELTINYSKEV